MTVILFVCSVLQYRSWNHQFLNLVASQNYINNIFDCYFDIKSQLWKKDNFTVKNLGLFHKYKIKSSLHKSYQGKILHEAIYSRSLSCYSVKQTLCQPGSFISQLTELTNHDGRNFCCASICPRRYRLKLFSYCITTCWDRCMKWYRCSLNDTLGCKIYVCGSNIVCGRTRVVLGRQTYPLFCRFLLSSSPTNWWLVRLWVNFSFFFYIYM